MKVSRAFTVATAAPSFRGDSVGRWEGDTLVVETKNFTDENRLYAEGNVSFHSE